MGLLEQIFGLFSLGYTIALAILKQNDLKPIDIVFMAATGAFVILSIVRFLNQLRVIPWGYKLRFTGKSLLRGLLGPLLWLFHNPILFYSKGWVNRALTFSNEAHDGVERTRQLDIFELVEFESVDGRNLTIHRLKWYGREQRWGYDRLVGEIWVKVRFEANFAENVDRNRRIQTSHLDMTLLLQYELDAAVREGHAADQEGHVADQEGRAAVREGHAAVQQRPVQILDVNTGRVHNPVEKKVKVSCLDCVCVDLDNGQDVQHHAQSPPTAPPLPEQYVVTITRRRTICRLQRCCLFTGFTWSLSCRGYQNWTLFQIHQYMLCLDAWGNHPKQGIWRPTDHKFKYCYRHDELIAAIGNNRRLRQRKNDGTWYTVV